MLELFKELEHERNTFIDETDSAVDFLIERRDCRKKKVSND